MHIDRQAGRALAIAAQRLPGPSARVDAEILLARVLGKPRSWLYAYPEALLDECQYSDFHSLLARRERGEPVAQIIGSREFWSLELLVTEDTLIPRPETELLVELALLRMRGKPGCRLLDLGTGSGAVALALASERLDAEVTAIDKDVRTLAVARKNAARLGLERVRFLAGNWFSPIKGEQFEVIASNPPYIADADPHLLQGDLRFEPRAALASGPDGLDAIRAIVAGGPRHLSSDGWLLLEHGFEQGAAVRTLMFEAGLQDVSSNGDLEHRERVTSGRRA